MLLILWRRFMQPLKKLDIVLTVYNQERLIQRVLNGIISNTTTPFNLILIFDGCTDQTENNARDFLRRVNNRSNLKKLITGTTNNVFETKANNTAFKKVTSEYFITIQDDMIVKEYSWEKRLTYPLRRFEDVFAVTARGAQDVLPGDGSQEVYANTADRQLGLPRNIFAIRDVINRGPIAFRTSSLKQLSYLDEDFAPYILDDADLSLRAWEKYKWRVGAFWIEYESKVGWGKTRSKGQSDFFNKANSKNTLLLYKKHSKYINSGRKHSIDITINDTEIDLVRSKNKKIIEKGNTLTILNDFLKKNGINLAPLRLKIISFKGSWRLKQLQENSLNDDGIFLTTLVIMLEDGQISSNQFDRALKRQYNKIV
jgi:glycosyltransferase involved in cell wall biosynthesis